MSNERALDDKVTEFLLKTCRPCPPSRSTYAVLAAIHGGVFATMQPKEDDYESVPLITGSVAEFYIEPMLPHVGDIDVMVHRNTELAIPQGHPPPTQLPAEFNNYVKVHEITDSHFPGYVYLALRYLLTECIDNDNSMYNAVECDEEMYLAYESQSTAETHGPAVLFPSMMKKQDLPTDHVSCVRCLLWPSQAADWPKRHRNYGWPDSATLDLVVSNGCDVVPVAHSLCRQNELIGKCQWRLSFSRAEIVLINSWTPVQQIVYHMLRFVKSELLTKSADNSKTKRLTDTADNSREGKLNNYHIKTLLLWACELRSRSWWTDDVNLVRICVHLLHILAQWLAYGRCQHYFISNCNLVINSFNVTNIRNQWMSVNETWLSVWFVDNYVQKCLQIDDCLQNFARLFDVVTTSMKLQNAVSVLVAWRQNRSHSDLFGILDFGERSITSCVYRQPLTAHSCVRWMTQWTKIDSHLSVYFIAVAFLHVATRLLKHGLNDKLMDILAIACGLQFADIRRNFYYSTSVLSLNIAAKLMEIVANKSQSTMSLIEIELSKAYLHRALRCKDSDSDSIYCLANVYLAVLYYSTGQYQTAIDYCTLVTRSQDNSRCSSHVVQGKILPKIDDDVNSMLGLVVLYQSVRTAALQRHCQPQLVSTFTSELFAYYLHVKFQAVAGSSQLMHSPMYSVNKFKRYVKCASNTPQLFVGDVLLLRQVGLRSQKTVQHKQLLLNSEHSLMITNNLTYLIELLQKSAVERLTTYRQLVARDSGSVATIVTTDFEALYAYKHGDYQHCLHLSTENVHSLLYAVRMYKLFIYPEFIQLMDDDFVSLIALILIVDPMNREAEDFADHAITQLTLSLYLMAQCQLRLHHSVTSLAQTLDYIEVARRRHSADRTLDQLMLKLIQRKVVAHVSTLL